MAFLDLIKTIIEEVFKDGDLSILGILDAIAGVVKEKVEGQKPENQRIPHD